MIFLKRRALMTRASFNYKTVSGIGSIVLENCVETRFKRLVLSGSSKQTSTKGLQLLDIAKIPTPQAGLSYYNMQVEEGKYTLSTKYRRAVQKDLFLLAGEVNTGASSNVNGVDSTISRTVESINGYITIGYRNGENGVNPLDLETMLNMGETPLPYEPYTGGKPSPSVEYPQEIVSAGKYDETSVKYLFDVNVIGKNLIDIDALKNENGYMSGAYEKSRDIDHFNIVKGKRYLLITKGKPLVAGDYSSVYFGDETLKYGVNHYDVLGTATGYTSFTSDLKQNRAILTAKKTATITKMILHGKANTRKDDYDVEEFGLFEILEDNTNIEYEPYKEPQTVRLQLEKPLTKWDRLEKREGVWGIARQSVREELTQYNFDTYILPSGSYLTGVYCYATKKSNAVLENQSSFCTHFKNSNYAYSITNAKVGIYSDHGRVPYKYFVSDKPTVDEFKAWLVQQKEAGTPVELVYKTAEETWEPLPEETQLALENLHANDGTTIITVDSGEVETGIEVEYAIKN